MFFLVLLSEVLIQAVPVFFAALPSTSNLYEEVEEKVYEGPTNKLPVLENTHILFPFVKNLTKLFVPDPSPALNAIPVKLVSVFPIAL